MPFSISVRLGARVVTNERIAVQDRAAETIASLRGLFSDERLLDGVQSARVGQAVERTETLKGRDAVPVDAGDGRDAGADGCPSSSTVHAPH